MKQEVDENLYKLIAAFDDDMSRARQEMERLSQELASTLRAFLRNPKHRRFLDLAADHVRAQEGGFTQKILKRLDERLSLRERLPRKEILEMTPFETRNMSFEEMTVSVYQDPPWPKTVRLIQQVSTGFLDVLEVKANLEILNVVYDSLTATQQKIADGIHEGLTDAEIARRLGISRPMVHKHRTRITRRAKKIVKGG